MSFVSAAFILFLLVTIAVYFLAPLRFRWVVLLAASYLFFFINSQWLVLVLLFTTAVTYLIGLAEHKLRERDKRVLQANEASMTREEKKAFRDRSKKKLRRLLILGIVIDLSVLLFLKYFDFFATNANVLLRHLGLRLPSLKLLLPLGISFYTLQAIAYMTDIYRGKLEPDRNFFQFMLFMSFFPQIVQGPIARHSQLAHQLYAGHEFDYSRLAKGAQLILWGWMKKTIIADRLALPVGAIFSAKAEHTGLIILLGAIGYGIQVYADFSGGMDMARGVSQIFGIELELNFRQPYFSRSIEEFWRRWHITLGSWMRDYVFYPLSLSKPFGSLSKKSRKILGNTVGKRLPAFLAMFIVYFLVGFWHGSSWKYIAYGVWNGVFIVAGILLTEQYARWRDKLGIDAEAWSWKLFQMIRTFFLRSLGLIFSRAVRLTAALALFKGMFYHIQDLSFLLDGTLTSLGLDTGNWIVLLISIAVLFVVDLLHERGVEIRETIARQPLIFRWAIYYGAIVLLLVFGLYGPGYNSADFVYEQF